MTPSRSTRSYPAVTAHALAGLVLRWGQTPCATRMNERRHNVMMVA
jgi:hypothetical protein